MPSPAEPSPHPAPDEGGTLHINIPIIPGLVSYKRELRPDSFLAKLWSRSPSLVRLGLAVGLILIVGLIGLGGWRLLRPGSVEPPPLYAVRVVVLGPDGLPVEDSDIRASAGNEPQRVPGGWEVEVPRTKVPEGGKITFWAQHPASSAHGSAEIVLGADPTPSVQIQLSVPETTVRGTVLGPDGRALAGSEVSVAGHGDEAVVTGPGGSFELPAHRPPGQQVRLHAEHPDYPPKDQYCWAASDTCKILLDTT